MNKMEKVMYIGNGFGSLICGTWYNLIKEYDNDYLVFDEYGNEAAIPKKDFADRDVSPEAKERAKNLMMLKDGYRLKKESETESEYGYIPKETDAHYDNSNGSLYLFAEQHKLNAYEFDIIKRIVRCRKKGYFHEDLAKSIRVIELYLKEYNL
jgi:hypothetical protein